MPIPVACRCGQKFAAKDELAGKATKCPKCGTVLQIPVPQTRKPAGAAPPAGPPTKGTGSPAATTTAPGAPSLADLLEEAGIKPVVEDTRPRCPNCKQPMEPDAVLCVNCGFNVQTGRQLEGVGVTGPAKSLYGLSGEGGHGAAAVAVLHKAERAIKDDKDEEFRIRTQGMPVWAIVIFLSTLITFTVCMSLYTTQEAAEYTGIVLASTSGLMVMIYGSLLRRVAFKDSAQEGVLCLLVPFYDVYYAIKHWKKCRQLFMIEVISSVTAIIGVMLLIFKDQLPGGGGTP
jgi:hypothetical protein